MKLKLFLKSTTIWYAAGLLIGQFWMPHMFAAMMENKLAQFLVGMLGLFILTCVAGAIELCLNAITEDP